MKLFFSKVSHLDKTWLIVHICDSLQFFKWLHHKKWLLILYHMLTQCYVQSNHFKEGVAKVLLLLCYTIQSIHRKYIQLC